MAGQLQSSIEEIISSALHDPSPHRLEPQNAAHLWYEGCRFPRESSGLTLFPGRLRKNNRAENSHLLIRRRERKMRAFKSQRSARKFLTTHAAFYDTFNVERRLTSHKKLRSFRADSHAAGGGRDSLKARGRDFCDRSELGCQSSGCPSAVPMRSRHLRKRSEPAGFAIP